MDNELLNLIRADLAVIKCDVKEIRDSMHNNDNRITRLEASQGWIRTGLMLVLTTIGAIVTWIVTGQLIQ